MPSTADLKIQLYQRLLETDPQLLNDNDVELMATLAKDSDVQLVFASAAPKTEGSIANLTPYALAVGDWFLRTNNRATSGAYRIGQDYDPIDDIMGVMLEVVDLTTDTNSVMCVVVKAHAPAHVNPGDTFGVPRRYFNPYVFKRVETVPPYQSPTQRCSLCGSHDHSNQSCPWTRS